jgi:HEAT repeat protein
VQISEEVVRVLSQELKSKSAKVREVALIELGNIGHPEGAAAVEAVSKCLWDADSSIRSAACWTVSRICPEATRKLENRLSELLRDHFWKVRTSACIALGLTARRPQNSTVEQLLRTLQDGSIPKATVCESLARMGAEELLL